MRHVTHEEDSFEDERGQTHAACSCGWEKEYDFYHGYCKWEFAHADYVNHVRSLADESEEG